MKLKDMEELMLQQMEVVRGGVGVAGAVCDCTSAANVGKPLGSCICTTAAGQTGFPEYCKCDSGAQQTIGLKPIVPNPPTIPET